jgi:hypothetical protein
MLGFRGDRLRRQVARALLFHSSVSGAAGFAFARKGGAAMKTGMTFSGLTGIFPKRADRTPKLDWSLEVMRANCRSWLAEAGEVQILLLLDAIVHELNRRGRFFPTEIPCFRTSGLHCISPAAVSSGGGTRPLEMLLGR